MIQTKNRLDKKKGSERMEQQNVILRELIHRISQLQQCKRVVERDILKGKYKESYDKMIEDIKDQYFQYCCFGMIRMATNPKEYCEVVRQEFVKHNREFSDACNYLKPPILSKKLKQIREEILEVEHAYCNQFVQSPEELKKRA